jgi:phosphohistidine swiveling domain-containing protein
VSREYGIPAVVGCTDATARISDNARLRVDGKAGEAVIVS